MCTRIPFFAVKREYKLYQMLKANVAVARLLCEQQKLCASVPGTGMEPLPHLRRQLRLPSRVRGAQLLLLRARNRQPLRSNNARVRAQDTAGFLENQPVNGGIWLGERLPDSHLMWLWMPELALPPNLNWSSFGGEKCDQLPLQAYSGQFE